MSGLKYGSNCTICGQFRDSGRVGVVIFIVLKIREIESNRSAHRIKRGPNVVKNLEVYTM